MSVLLAAARVRFLPFIAGTTAGLIPRTVAICYVSAQTATLDLSKKGSMLPFLSGLVILLLLVAGLTLLSRYGIEKIEQEDPKQ